MFVLPWSLLLIAVLFAHQASALPSSALSTKASSTCSTLAKRVNWNTLSTAQRTQYFNAVKCLKTKPTVSGIKTSKTLFDDFPAIHIQQSHNIHGVAAFLPWHRRFVQARERALRSCGYTGPTPYWDWTKAADTGKPKIDPVFSTQKGFGGNGDQNKDGAVTKGPFGNFTVDMREGDSDTPLYDPHLLRRELDDNPVLIGLFNSTAVAKGQVIPTFNDYRYYLEGTPHGAVHQYIAGDMAPSQSPNDPLFFLHHAQVDRLWALWQDQNPSKRLTDYKGNLPGGSSKDGPWDATLNDKLTTFGNLISQVRVRDVMNIRAGDLCYEYV
ncbi:Tyrosinase_Cu-bd domain-containing protein [Pseudozyma hubeiensis]|nr:Tyrosinase_Cu-bd domain-containing protein [Pseudozyma hubeiensis]